MTYHFVNWVITLILDSFDRMIDITKDKLKEYDMAHRHMICMTRANKSFFYYEQHKHNGIISRSYLGTSSDKTVQAIKLAHYYDKKLKVLVNDRKAIQKAFDALSDYSPESINSKLPNAYRDLPRQMFEDDMLEELKAWANAEYLKNQHPFPRFKNTSCDGTYVRSKGECIWYDNLLAADIPFRYDPRITLTDTNGKEYIMYPDFQIKCPDGSFILVEHLGMLNDETYADNLKNKLMIYEYCGYTIGDNLIVTSDNTNGSINELMILRQINMIKSHFEI